MKSRLESRVFRLLFALPGEKSLWALIRPRQQEGCGCRLFSAFRNHKPNVSRGNRSFALTDLVSFSLSILIIMTS